MGDAEMVVGAEPPRLGLGKWVRVPPAAGSEPIAPRRVRSWPVLRVPQGTRGPRETGGPADPGSHNRGRTIARPVTGRVRLPPCSEAGRLGSVKPASWLEYPELWNLVGGKAAKGECGWSEGGNLSCTRS